MPSLEWRIVWAVLWALTLGIYGLLNYPGYLAHKETNTWRRIWFEFYEADYFVTHLSEWLEANPSLAS